MPPVLLIPFQQRVTRLTSSGDVEQLLGAIKHRNEIAFEIEILEVSVKTLKGSAFKSIREILCRTQNITDLVLRLSFKPICILPPTVVLNRLTSLDVNIPHSTIAQLLQSHSHIENLALGPCNNTLRCPLTNCSLPALQCLTCPPSCTRAITHSSPVRWLAATYDGEQHARFPILRLLDFHPIQTSAVLTTLHLDFDSTTERLLLRVSVAAPALVYLKLTESSSSVKVLYLQHSMLMRSCDAYFLQVAPMPWDDTESWQAGLRSLSSLERLMLRSWHRLRETTDMEDAFIVRWLHSPLRLRNVIVWSGARGGMGRLGVWDNQEIGWRKTHGQVSMNAGDCLIDPAAFA
jgi:hypothetical protein